MDKFIIKGGNKLSGTVTISGSKNSSLPIIAATILNRGKNIIRNVPNLNDIRTMLAILTNLGAKVNYDPNTKILLCDTANINNWTAPYKLVSKMRASVCVLGPLLARFKKANVSYPGGCVIGPRPIDLHIKGLRLLGADLEIKHGYVEARTGKLKGREIFLSGTYGSSVLGTDNVMCAAVLADGITVIEGAACEPEVLDLANCLNKMGAKISGAGTPTVTIEGVKNLKPIDHTVISDRIETGTFIMAAAITRSKFKILNANLNHLAAVVDKLEEMGIKITADKNYIEVSVPKKQITSTSVTTLPYPGFPTDLQAQFMALATTARGISVVNEKIYPDRFMHVSELMRMGANIIREGSQAVISGRTRLSGAPVMASDLRASAALVLAGLVAENTTEIFRVYHIDRGYEKIEDKLQKLGAKIKRLKE